MRTKIQPASQPGVSRANILACAQRWCRVARQRYARQTARARSRKRAAARHAQQRVQNARHGTPGAAHSAARARGAAVAERKKGTAICATACARGATRRQTRMRARRYMKMRARERAARVRHARYARAARRERQRAYACVRGRRYAPQVQAARRAARARRQWRGERKCCARAYAAGARRAGMLWRAALRYAALPRQRQRRHAARSSIRYAKKIEIKVRETWQAVAYRQEKKSARRSKRNARARRQRCATGAPTEP